MSERRLLRSALFGIGVFILVLITLQLYYLLVDEESTVHFSDHPSKAYGSDNMNQDYSLAREYNEKDGFESRITGM